MKIKEAINRIESTSKSIFVWEHEGYIHISWNTFTILVVPYEAKTMFDCHFVNPNLELPADVKAQISGIIGKFLRTPIKERFPEKKYRLVANPNSFEQTGTYATKYVACIQDGMDGFSFVYGGPTVFSEKELKQIEELHPNIAPAIETMKEEVKDNEAD